MTATQTRSRLVPATAEAVWEVLSDLAGIAGWADNADHASMLTEQPEGVGAARRVQAGKLTLVETVTAWEPAARLAYDITGMPKVLRAVSNEWRLEATGTATTVSLTSTVDCGHRPPQQLIARIAARRLGKASDTMLAGLDARLRQLAAAAPHDRTHQEDQP